jgi:hypothetical protein
VPIVLKSGSLNLLETSGLSRPVMGLLYLLYLIESSGGLSSIYFILLSLHYRNTSGKSHLKITTHNVAVNNPQKDVRKAVCNKTQRKTKNEMTGLRVYGPEKDGNKRMER